MHFVERIRAFVRYRGRSRAERFDWIYKTNFWADEESRSGVGSRLDRTEALRAGLVPLLERHNCHSMLDIGCGDFNWLSHVDLGSVDYTGVDISAAAIEENRQYATEQRRFKVLDGVEEVPPKTDLVLCRDVLYHLCFADSKSLLENVIASGSKFLLATTHPETETNKDIVSGSFSFQNLALPPFSFPEPIERIEDAYGEVLGLWQIADLGDC